MTTHPVLPLIGLGDSLMCGVSGYSVAPHAALFAHVCRAFGQPIDPPRVRWDMLPFEAACALPPGHPALAQVYRGVAQLGARLLVDARAPEAMFAVPGFSIVRFLRAHEATASLGEHLRALCRAFLNPTGALPASPLQRVLARPPACACLVWLGGVEWISCLLGWPRQPALVADRMAGHLARVLIALRGHARRHGAPPPRLVVGGIIAPTRLPVLRATADGAELAFKPPGARLLPCERLTPVERSQLDAAVVRCNDQLRELTARFDGVFVDCDALLAGVFARGHHCADGVVVPAGDLIGPDLVHPTAAGHAMLAQWFVDALGTATGAVGAPVAVAAAWAEQRRRARPPHPVTWPRLLELLYGTHLYRVPRLRATA